MGLGFADELCGVRGVIAPVEDCPERDIDTGTTELPEKFPRGTSRDMRPSTLPLSSLCISGLSSRDCCGAAVDGAEGDWPAPNMFSKWLRKEETGFYDNVRLYHAKRTCLLTMDESSVFSTPPAMMACHYFCLPSSKNLSVMFR